MDGKSFNKDGPFYFEQSDGEDYDQFDLTPLVHPNSVAKGVERPFESQISESRFQNKDESKQTQIDNNHDNDEVEAKFWPASSQISFTRPDPEKLSLYDSALFTSANFRDEKSTATGAHKSYLEHLRDQALGPQAVLKGLKVDAYLQMPKKTPTPNSDNLLRALFREGPILPLHKETKYRHQQKDSFFKYAFMSLSVAMMIMGFFIVILFPSDVRNGILTSPSLYRVLVESAKAFSSVIAFTSALAILWTLLLQRFTRGIVYLMIGFVPASCFATGLWALSETFHRDDIGTIAGYSWLLLLATASFSASLISTIVIALHLKTIRTSVMITKMASNILCENPSVYIASFFIILCYIGYAIMWTFMFAHLLLLGHFETINGPNIIKEWQLSSWSYILQAFFILMLIWTTSIFSNVQKTAVAGVVSRWYFFHEHPDYSRLRFQAFDSIGDAINNYFGQICFGSLIITFAKSLRNCFWLYNKAVSKVSGRWTRIGLNTAGSFIGFAEKLVEHITEFALYHVTLTGESLCKSGREVSKIFRRNALLSFTADYIAEMILFLSTLAIAALTGMGSFSYASHVLKSQYGWAVGMLFGALSWYILRFFSSIYTDTMDVALLCYVMDLDMNKVHSSKVHQALSSRVINSKAASID